MTKNGINEKVLGVYITLIIVVILYFINVGFDLKDEGYYFLGYIRNQPIFFSFSGFHNLIKLLPFSDEIVINRLYRLFFHILTAYGLAKAISGYFKSSISKTEMFFWILLGNLYSYVYAPPSLSYNFLNLIFIQLTLTIYLFHLANPAKKFQFYFLFILVSSLTFYNKASSGVLMFLLYSIDYFFRFEKNKFDRLVRIFIAGLLISVIVFFLFYMSKGNYLVNLIEMIYNKSGPFQIKQTSFPFQIKQLLWNPIYQSKKQFLFLFGYLSIYCLTKSPYLKEKNNQAIINFSYLLLTIGFLFYYINRYAYGPGVEIFTVLILFLFINIILEGKFHKEYDWKILLTISCLPIIGFFGSDVAPFEGMNHYAVFFVFLIVYFMQDFEFNYSIIWGGLITCFILLRFIVFPFENPPLNTIKKEISINQHFTKFLVNDTVLIKYDKFNKVIHNLDASKSIVFFNIPSGLIYLANQKNYGTIYYNNYSGLQGYIATLNILQPPTDCQYVIGKEKLSNESLKLISDYFFFSNRKNGAIDTILNNKDFMLINFSAFK